MLFTVKVIIFTFDALAGGSIALWKSVVITVKVEIGTDVQKQVLSLALAFSIHNKQLVLNATAWRTSCSQRTSDRHRKLH